MRSIGRTTGLRVAAFCTSILLGASGVALAQVETYEGDVVAVDTSAMTYTVKGTRPGEQVEMAFAFNPASRLMIDGEPRLLGEIVKGDHVVVRYDTIARPLTVLTVDRIHTRSRESTFVGRVIAVNPAAHTFVVEKTASGEPREMAFHVSVGAQLFVGGERVLFEHLKKDDAVTVAYESIEQVHHVRHLKVAP